MYNYTLFYSPTHHIYQFHQILLPVEGEWSVAERTEIFKERVDPAVESSAECPFREICFAIKQTNFK